MSDIKEVDEVTGTTTTGHEWDGIYELDTPMPRWWLWTMYATLVWGFIYMVLYPAVPLLNDYTKGTLGYSSRAEVAQNIADAAKAQSGLRSKLEAASLEQIKADPQLFSFAKAVERLHLK